MSTDTFLLQAIEISSENIIPSHEGISICFRRAQGSLPLMRLSDSLIRPSRSLTRSSDALRRGHVKTINFSSCPSIRLLPANIGKIPCRVPYVIDSEHDDNKARLKDVEVPLMRVKIAIETSRELNHTVDGAKEDHGRASVDGPQHRGPSCVRPLFTEAP